MVFILIIVVLLVFSAFFSASETAFSSVNKIRLKNYAVQGNKRAEKALKIADQFDKTLTTILIGNNIVNILSSSIGTVLFTETLGLKGSGVAVSTIVMTILVLTFGEILPKTYAKENSEKFVLFATDVLNFLIILMTPFVWLFGQLRKAVSKIMKNGDAQPSVTEDELKYIIDEIENEGVLEERESNLVKSALEFDEIPINQILIPRVNVVAVEINDSVDKIKEIFLNEMYSRIPVFEDTIDNIIGVIHQKDFFKMLLGGGTSIQNIITDALYIPELKLIHEVLQEMQKNKIHMAIVLDQYGGTKGIVTLEDIIEELVGEIYDENDEIIQTVKLLDDGSFEISGELSIADMIETLNLPAGSVESDSNSVGGWVMEIFEKIPIAGDTTGSGIFNITVLEVDEQRIVKIKLKIENHEEQDDNI